MISMENFSSASFWQRVVRSYDIRERPKICSPDNSNYASSQCFACKVKNTYGRIGIFHCAFLLRLRV